MSLARRLLIGAAGGSSRRRLRQPADQRADRARRHGQRLSRQRPDPRSSRTTIPRRCSCWRSRAAARVPRRSPTACSRSCGAPRSWWTASSARLLDEVDLITGVSGGSFTALSYALYGDKLFAEYEDALSEAQRAGRPARAQRQSVQLAEDRRRQLWALRAGSGLLRRDPVPRRDVRRPDRQAHAHGGGHRHRPVDRGARGVRAVRLRSAVLGSEQSTPRARRRGVLGGARRAVAGDVHQLWRHLRVRVSRCG